jgi:type II secretory pathway pseudopilin PulG
MRIGSRPRQAGSRGFTYLWLLFVVALGGVALAALGQRQQMVQQRERETELRFRGEAIAKAIASYMRHSPDGANGLPQRLEDLLEDRRSGAIQRHLRRLYTDPFTGRADWLLIQGQVAPQQAGQDQGLDESEKLVHSKPATALETPGVPLVSGIVGVSSRSQALLLASPAGKASPTPNRKPRVSELRFMAAADVDAAPE